MNNVQVFEGDRFETKPPVWSSQQERCRFMGRDSSGQGGTVPLSEQLLSSHLLFLGGIGTGKTNAIFQLLTQIKGSMTDRDVMLVFDTKVLLCVGWRLYRQYQFVLLSKYLHQM